MSCLDLLIDKEKWRKSLQLLPNNKNIYWSDGRRLDSQLGTLLDLLEGELRLRPRPRLRAREPEKFSMNRSEDPEE